MGSKQFLTWTLLLTALALGAPAVAGEDRDVDAPEPVTFLQLAADEMAQFHREYHAYARDWYRLGFSYALPTYRVTDPDISPRPEFKNRWKPRGSHFTYVIVAADADHFQIQALDDRKRISYELRENVKEPRKLR